MKLFRKVFLQAILGVLVVSQVTLIFFLYESQRQNLNEVGAYELSLFYQRAKEFEAQKTEGIFSGGSRREDMEQLSAIEAFRKCFGSQGALYEMGEEVFNTSPYEFDFRALRKRARSKGEEAADYETVIGGRHLLVFTGVENTNYARYGYVYYKDVTDIYDRTAKLFVKGLVMSLGLFVLAGWGLFLGIRRAILPLQKLKEAAASIAEGNYGASVEVHTGDEIGQLTKSFNHMSATIEENIRELKKTNETQRRLLGSLAHELKTPMTAIMGYADTLLTVRLSNERREQALLYIQKECRRLSRLSVKMLELTGLYQEGAGALEQEETFLETLFEEVRHLAEFRLREKGIVLETVCREKDLSRKMNVDMMTSFLLNLVDNACKASQNGGKIVMGADRQEIFVEDFGRGIPEEELEKVTEAFYMVDKSRSRNEGSAGLGLALCKEIAELHKGRLVLESEQGKGTKVRILWN